MELQGLMFETSIVRAIANAIYQNTAQQSQFVLATAFDAKNAAISVEKIGYSNREADVIVERLSDAYTASGAGGDAAIKPSEFLCFDTPAGSFHLSGRHACVPLPSAGALASKAWLVARVPDEGDPDSFLASVRTAVALLGTLPQATVLPDAAPLKVLVSGLAEAAPISLLVAADSRILETTEAAAALLSVGAGPVFQVANRLRLRPRQRAQFEAALKSVLNQSAPPHAAEVIPLKRGSGRAPLVLLVRALPPAAAALHAKSTEWPFAWVSLRGREILRSPSVSHLRATWGLSAREADLVRGLMLGETIKARAFARGVTEDAEWNHLKSVLKKTGCSGQNELLLTVFALLGPCLEAPVPELVANAGNDDLVAE